MPTRRGDVDRKAARPGRRGQPRLLLGNTHVPTSSFLGRQAELERITQLFGDSQLVSLVAPGGMGKTRLAMQFAATCASMRARAGQGRVWCVDLSTVGAADKTELSSALVSTVANVLEVDLRSCRSELAMSDAVGDHLARVRPSLIVLDNAEGVVSSLRQHLSRWIAAAPFTRFLVTSRVLLGIAEERVLLLEPLPPSEAERLFIERVRAVRGDDGFTPAEQALVFEIVSAIDCMPLAIELAASRTRVLTLTELHARRERRLEVLANPASTHPRHGSMRQSVLASVNALDPPMRSFFALLSLFRNGFTLAALESTFADDALPKSPLEAVDELVGASLLRADVRAGGVARFALFETLREVAAELCVEHPLAEATRAKHARTYASIARRLRALPTAEALPEIALDFDNLYVALLTLLESDANGSDGQAANRTSIAPQSRTSDAVQIALAIDPLLARRGAVLRERTLTRVVELATRGAGAQPDGSTENCALPLDELLVARGGARRELGEIDEALADFNSVLSRTADELEAALESDDRVSQASGKASMVRATAWLRLAEIADVRGETKQARDRLAEALAMLSQLPDAPGRRAREAEALLRLGHVHRRECNLSDATAALSRAEERYRQACDPDGLAAVLYEQGAVAMFAGETARAHEYFDEGLTLARRAGNQLLVGACVTARGCLLQDLGRILEASEHHAEAAAIFCAQGSRYREASALYYLATTYLERAAPREAIELLAQAKTRIEGVGAARYAVLMYSASAIARALLGECAASDAEFAKARDALERVPHESALHILLELHAASLSVRRGEAAPFTAARARQRMLESPTDDSRFALREYERALGVRCAPAVDALCIWGEGAAFAPPGRSRVQLPEGSPLRRILAFLVTRREQAPADPATLEAILAAGWPGEKMAIEAGLNRAHVALATLRRRGLGALLVRIGGGYALSPAVALRRIEA